MLQRLSVFTITVAGLLITTHPLLALNTRSWVSAEGSDANSCIRTSPCKTFQHAHDQTLPSGEIDVIDPGEYGWLNVSKSIVIDGGNMAYIEVVGNNIGIVVSAAPPDRVTIRNLSIRGSSNGGTGGGIYWDRGQALFVENVQVNGVDTAIYVAHKGGTIDVPAAPFFFAKDVTITDVKNGIALSGANNAETKLRGMIEHAAITDIGSVGISVLGGKVTIRNSTISRAAYAGVSAWNLATVDVSLESSTVTHSYFGVNAQDGALLRISDCGMYQNHQGYEFLLPAKVLSFANNRIEGNEFSPAPPPTIALK